MKDFAKDSSFNPPLYNVWTKAKAFNLWLSCHTQEQIAEAVGVSQQTVTNWQEGFTNSCSLQDFVKDQTFQPPLYNVWTKAKAFNLWLSCHTQEQIAEAVGIGEASASRWTENFLQTCKMKEWRNDPTFSPPLYNVWTKAKAFNLWLSCHTQEQIAEAVGVDRSTPDSWKEGFLKNCTMKDFRIDSAFQPPIYQRHMSHATHRQAAVHPLLPSLPNCCP